jgi:pyruvate dehydrogenase E2 component (dihydrolipoamide acetyltransferase)
MPHEVFVPKTGIYMDDVHLLEWHVEEGSRVEVGQPLFRIETNKVEQDVEAEVGGYLRRRALVGEDYPIGTVIGWIAEDEATYRSLAEAGESG